jgi:hypothetical protein
MNNRLSAWFAAAVFLLIGIWCSWDGWHKSWKSKGVALRVAGVAALAAGTYSVAVARR